MLIGGRATLDDPVVTNAVAHSQLHDLSPDALTSLLNGATRIHAPAGTIVRDFGEPGPYMQLLVDGFLRVFVRAPDGRSLTVRYLRPGELSGVVSLFTPDYTLAATVEALVDSELIAFRGGVVRALAETNVLVARALIRELSDRVVNFVAEIPGSVFSTVRQRVARHLLDLASEQRHGDILVARVSQQALAEAVGSVREVVVRVLRDLRAEGVIRTGRNGIELLDPEQLVDEQFYVRHST